MENRYAVKQSCIDIDNHDIRVSLKDFAAPIGIPKNLFPAQSPQDLRLQPDSTAMDAGTVLPNINDDYTGATPDLGAYELGQSIPHYGPRGLLGN